jgi:hypothetical protein
LGVAAGDDDFGRGISAMRPPNKGAGHTVGFGSHAACVNDNDVGSERLAFGKRPHVSGNGLAIRTRSAASEVLDKKPRHRPSLVGFFDAGDSRDAGPAS